MGTDSSRLGPRQATVGVTATPGRSVPPGLGLALWRALRRRCPWCGGPIFRTWLKVHPSCPGCRLRTDRGEPDYYFGAWTIAFIAAEGLVVVIGVAAVLATWPEVPWGWVQVLVLGLALPLPLVTIPFSRVLWLAVDLVIRRAEAKDFLPDV